MGTQLILASASPRRKQLLEGLGFVVRCVPAKIEEIPFDGEEPVNFVKRMARDKVLAVARRTHALAYAEAAQATPGANSSKEDARWIVGADTIVVANNQIFGKPEDTHDAYEMLSTLAGREHEVITGFCVLDVLKNKEGIQAVHTSVRFKRASKDEIDKYIAMGEGSDKAGAYAIQGIGAYLVESIRGSYTNVVGLPLCQVIEMMQEMGADDILPF